MSKNGLIKKCCCGIILVYCVCVVAGNSWITEGFAGFSKGTFGNGGQNLYVSKQGILQRIHQTDFNQDGYTDLLFCNSQNHEEYVPLDIYAMPTTSPEQCGKLFIGGAAAGAVADLNRDGYEDLVLACGWDGRSSAQVTNSIIFYGSPEGLTNRYINYLPITHGRAVAIGDFNKDGRPDLAFLSGSHIKIVYNQDSGFDPSGEYPQIEVPSSTLPQEQQLVVCHLLAVPTADGRGSDLVLQKEDGSCTVIRGGSRGLELMRGEQSLLPGIPGFKKIQKQERSYLQSVASMIPRFGLLQLKDGLRLAVFRPDQVLLYRYRNGGIDGQPPLVFGCRNAYAIAAGDLRRSGYDDLVFACRDQTKGNECSWIYPGSSCGWDASTRIMLPTSNACDVVLADFSRRGGLDIVIGQNRSRYSYDSQLLLFCQNGKGLNELDAPLTLPSHDATRIFAIMTGQDKTPHLVVKNIRSGSAIGNPLVEIFLGGADGFRSDRRLRLPGWGTVSAVGADLNDDGRPDITLANASEMAPWLDQGSFIYYNSPTGFATMPDQRLPTRRAHGVVCGDLNHDGWLDLVFGGFDNPELTVYYGSATGFTGIAPRTIRMEANGRIWQETRFLALTDLNCDGWLDLIVPQITSPESFVLWGGPQGFDFKNRQAFQVRNACNANVADLNHDGFPDLIFGGHAQSIGKPHDAFLYIYWGGAGGYNEARRTLLPSNAVNSTAVADFNRDGELDIFIASYENGRERDIDSFIYWNREGRGFVLSDRTPLRTHAASGNMAADFNGDGWIDLAIANHKVYNLHTAYSTVWYNGPQGFSASNTVNLPTEGVHGILNVDPGNIMSRSPAEYYVSESFRLPKDNGITGIGWDGTIPATCRVRAQFRFADRPEKLSQSPWLGTTGPGSWITAADPVDRMVFTGNYVQYRIALEAYDAMNTPRLSKVTVRFDRLDVVK